MIINHYDNDSFECLCQRLNKDDPSLTLINWNNRGIGGSLHCELLSNALSHNHHAVVLFLQQNQIRTLRHVGHAVQFLYLRGNANIDVRVLTDAILRTNQVCALSLAQCQLEEADSIVRLVSSCTSLRKLDISGNPKLGHRIPDILRAAHHLEQLDVSDCCDAVSFSGDDSSLDDITQLLDLRTNGDWPLPSRWRYCIALNQAGRRHWGDLGIPASLYPRIMQKAAKISPDVSFRLLRERPDLLIPYPPE